MSPVRSPDKPPRQVALPLMCSYDLRGNHARSNRRVLAVLLVFGVLLVLSMTLAGRGPTREARAVAAPARDAGPPPVDAAPPIDAGPPPVDAAPPIDAAPPMDAGPRVDAGPRRFPTPPILPAPPIDAGRPLR